MSAASQPAMPAAQTGPAQIGPKPELAWLPQDRLIIDPAYQRTCDTARSQKLIALIAARFEWARFGVLMTTVSAGERWHVLDGQHRLMALRRRGGIALVPAVVYPAMTTAEAARVFVAANMVRRPMDQFSLHRAALAGGDDKAQRIEALVAGAGIRIPRSNPSKKNQRPGEVLSVAVFGQLIERYPAVAADAAGAVAEAYAGEVGALRVPFFTAAAVMLAAGSATRAQLAAAFRQSTGAALYADVMRRGATGKMLRVDLVRHILGERLARMPKPARDVAPGSSSAFPEHAPAAAPDATGREAAQPRPGSIASDDRAAIDRYIADKGVTRLAPGFAAATEHASLDGAAARQKIAALPAIETARRPGESKAAWYERNARPRG